MVVRRRKTASPWTGCRWPTKGGLNYERTFSAETVPEGLLEHLSSVHVVQHGIDANNNDKYDAERLGVSTFAESLGGRIYRRRPPTRLAAASYRAQA